MNFGGRIMQRIEDAAREARIAFYALQMNSFENSERSYWFQKMREEVAQRSPEQVARMERERGLV